VTKRLLPPGTPVRLLFEPATDRVDQYGRLLRYVIRAKDGLNVNLRLVRVGAAAPYFYRGRRGMFAARLEALALRARRLHLGLISASAESVECACSCAGPPNAARHDAASVTSSIVTRSFSWSSPSSQRTAVSRRSPLPGVGRPALSS
jgi:hypothetical protein